MSLQAAPIRQPRGPSSNPSADSFNPIPSAPISPPPADQDSALRRNNTIGSTRHQPSASIGGSAAASGAFHGTRYRPARDRESRFRSGSLSSKDGEGVPTGLSRKQSGREVRKEEVVPEDAEMGTAEMGGWGNSSVAGGLNRQSSLPSRRGTRTTVHPPLPEPMAPPPRPPRRISVAGSEATSPPMTHSVSQSLSSLAMLNRPGQSIDLSQQAGAAVSRAQSLRSQARHGNPQLETDPSTANHLGRSSSLRQAGEHHRSLSAITSSPSLAGSVGLSGSPYAQPTPPPASSAAALPPFQLPSRETPVLHSGADIKRHQSLGHNYGRERARPPALLSLEQRLERPPGLQVEEPPTSPIGRSVWAPNQPTDDGWSRSIHGVQEAFSAMNFRGQEDDRGTRNVSAAYSHTTEEPSWVANLVDGRESSPAPPQRTPSAPVSPWQNDGPRGGAYQNQRWPEGFVPISYLQQPQQQQMGYNLGLQGFKPGMANMPGYPAAGPGGYLTPMTPNFYAPQPQPSIGPQDQEVIELARKKGLNPATFDCRPVNARFFVIKSYTEDDVQKSLKHEIWSSTVLGNKRLDAAFKENANKGPVYLFFSVNSSRHFCGVAQMLTPVDETQTSTVWAQDKWKGIFKVKWIFVRDVPSTALRHIRLINTTEQKPITNSRDTQEVHYEGGVEVLQIFLDHQTKSKTSLLQDFAYYETMSQNRTPGGTPSPHITPPFQQQGMMPPQPLPPIVGPPIGSNPGGFMTMPILGQNVPPVPPIPSRYR